MLLTEAEAKEKACVQFPRDFHLTRDTPTGPEMRPALCRGSQCMAWRSESLADYAERIRVGASRINQVLAELKERNVEAVPRRGYCGLAGKPDPL